MKTKLASSLCLITTLISCSLQPPQAHAANLPKKALWLHELMNEGQTPATINKLAIDVKATGFDTVFAWVLPGHLENNKKFDTVFAFKKAAKDHGLKFHIWYSPMYDYDGTFATKNASLMSKNRQGRNVKILEISHPQAEKYALEKIQTLLTKYSPDGFHLEETYYQDGVNYCHPNLINQFRQTHKYNPCESEKTTPDFTQKMGDIKLKIVNNFMTKIKKITQKIGDQRNRKIIFSATGPATEKTDEGYNFAAIEKLDIFDFYVPQNYHTNQTDFNNAMKFWNKKSKLPVLIGIAARWSGHDKSLNPAFEQQFKSTKTNLGTVVFAWWGIKNDPQALQIITSK